MNFVEVDSLDAVVAAARRLGGTILKDKTAVPRTAWHAVIADPAGNAMLVWQPDPIAFPPPEPDQGANGFRWTINPTFTSPILSPEKPRSFFEP